MSAREVLLLGRPATGGLRAHVSELVRRLDQDRWTPIVCGPSDFLASLPQDIADCEKETCPVAAKLSPTDLAAARRLTRIVRNHEKPVPPIVHAHGIRAAWIASLAHLTDRFSLAVTLHNVPPAGAIGRIAVRFLASRADHVICVSQAIADRVSPTATVIPNGVDLARYQSLDRSAARAAFGLADADFVVGCIARLSPEKGVDVLIEAARALSGTTVLITGDGPERDALSRNLPPNVRMLGRVESILPILAASDVIAVPSRSEGQGIVALEAMASARAVVASNVGGLPGMIDDGMSGLLVPPESPTALAEALGRLRDEASLRAGLARGGYDYAQAHGDIAVRMRQIEAVYAELAG